MRRKNPMSQSSADLTVQRDIVIEAPAEVVWRTITEPEHISKWFWPVELELRPGGRGAFSFKQDEHGGFVVETVDPPNTFSFRWAYPEGEAPRPGNSVLVEFSLTPETGTRTRLSVVETGVELLGWSDEDKANYVAEHRHGWQVHFERLAELVRG
jgi:uncharacterized protein YndB with AHSA1/START domain